MADQNITQGCARQSSLDLSNIIDEICGASTDAREIFNSRGRDSIEVFAADRQPNDKIGEGCAIVRNGGSQG